MDEIQVGSFYASKLGMNSTKENSSERKIVIVDNKESVVGFEVDTVSEVLKIRQRILNNLF